MKRLPDFPKTLEMAEAKPSFYKKALPNSCIAFHDNHGKSIFKEALQGPFMECYFTLSSQFLTQSEPAFCGLST
jgi:glutathione gamma-glutamylcysteinyltransferase